MSHEHTRALCLKLLDKWKIAAALAGIDIAVDSPHHRAHLLETADDVDAADVAGVPDFVAVGEMAGKPFVPAGMGVRQDPDSFHAAEDQKFWRIITWRGANVIFSAIVTSSPVTMSRRVSP